jgi:hypothetical protein
MAEGLEDDRARPDVAHRAAMFWPAISGSDHRKAQKWKGNARSRLGLTDDAMPIVPVGRLAEIREDVAEEI